MPSFSHCTVWGSNDGLRVVPELSRRLYESLTSGNWVRFRGLWVPKKGLLHHLCFVSCGQECNFSREYQHALTVGRRGLYYLRTAAYFGLNATPWSYALTILWVHKSSRLVFIFLWKKLSNIVLLLFHLQSHQGAIKKLKSRNSSVATDNSLYTYTQLKSWLALPLQTSGAGFTMEFPLHYQDLGCLVIRKPLPTKC